MLKIEKFSSDFEKIKFVVLARGNDKLLYGRPYSEVLHVEKDGEKLLILATDGRRMHVAILKNEIPEGNYIVTTSNAKMIILEEKDGIVYPEWKRVFPYYSEKWAEYEKFIDDFDMPGKKDMVERSLKLREFFMAYTGCVNIEYLFDIEGNTFDVYRNIAKPLDRGVCFINPIMQAIIMPLSIE